MKLLKEINYEKTYVNKDGKELPSTRFLLEFDNGKYVEITARWPNGKYQLDCLCEIVKLGKKND